MIVMIILIIIIIIVIIIVIIIIIISFIEGIVTSTLCKTAEDFGNWTVCEDAVDDYCVYSIKPNITEGKVTGMNNNRFCASEGEVAKWRSEAKKKDSTTLVSSLKSCKDV